MEVLNPEELRMMPRIRPRLLMNQLLMMAVTKMKEMQLPPMPLNTEATLTTVMFFALAITSPAIRYKIVPATNIYLSFIFLDNLDKAGVAKPETTELTVTWKVAAVLETFHTSVIGA